MKFGFSKNTIITLCIFILAFVFIMLNQLVDLFFYFALVLFLAGFTMLTINSYKKFVLCKKEQKRLKIELLMEIATTENGAEYIVRDTPFSRSEEMALRRDRYNKVITVLTFALCVLVILIVLVRAIIG